MVKFNDTYLDGPTSADEMSSDAPEPGVHVWVAGEQWDNLRIGTADEEGEDVIIHDNVTGAPLAALITDAEGIRLAYWDDDGEWHVAHTVPYIHNRED